MIARHTARMLQGCALALLTLATCQACGPDFFPDVFVRTQRPDLPARYVAGHLGILHTEFPRADLFVAYRYLSGGTLTPEEQKGWSVTYPLDEQYYGSDDAQSKYDEPKANDAIVGWQTARARYGDSPAAPADPNRSVKTKEAGGYEYEASFPNCLDDAFRTATATLASRAASWGTSSSVLRDWLRGQDAVFAACHGPAPEPQSAPAGSPVLLQQDRAYQIAAAQFYAGKFDNALRGFRAIYADKASPWSTTSGYLVARVLVRQAFLSKLGAEEPADYDPALMQAAGDEARRFLASNPPEPWRHAAEKQVQLVRIRLEPEARTRELAVAVAGPGKDANYAQNAQDLLWAMRNQVPDGLRADPEPWERIKLPDGTTRLPTDAEAAAIAVKKRDDAFSGSAKLRALAPMLDWTITIQALTPAAPQHALEQWRATHSLPWLVAALMLAPDSPYPDAGLLAAAAQVPQNSPAWQTVIDHRARLLLDAGDNAAARAAAAALTSALERASPAAREPSSINTARGLTMRAAADRSTFLANVPRQVLLHSSEEYFASNDCKEVMSHKGNWHHCIAGSDREIDTDAARLLNQAAPLPVWLAVAQAADVPKPVREAVAMQGWARATVLEDKAAAARFTPLLPADMRTETAAASPLGPWLVLLRNPGLSPWIGRGDQRAYAWDFVENYRENWCYKPQDEDLQWPHISMHAVGSGSTPPPNAAWLSAAELTQGQAESVRAARFHEVDLGQRALAAVAAHPHDPLAAEALFRILRMIRYGCTPVKEPGEQFYWSMQGSGEAEGVAMLHLRRDTVRLMRKHFAASPWTTKSAPFVGEVHIPDHD